MAGSVLRSHADVLADVEWVYNHFDTEKCGYLTRRQFKLAHTALFGVLPSKCEVEQMFTMVLSSSCIFFFETRKIHFLENP